MGSSLDQALKAIKSGVSAEDALALLGASEITEKEDGVPLSLTQSFFIRALEWAREEATDDNQIHGFAEAVSAKSCPKDAEDSTTVKANDFKGLVKSADEAVAAAGVGGFVGDASSGTYGPSKSFKKSKDKKGKKGKVRESILEYMDENRPCFRIEFDCFEQALTMAVDKKMKRSVAKMFTNFVARYVGGVYTALSFYDLKKAWESYETAGEEDEGESKKKKKSKS